MKSLARIWAENIAYATVIGGIVVAMMGSDSKELHKPTHTDYSSRMQKCSDVRQDPNSHIAVPCVR